MDKSSQSLIISDSDGMPSLSIEQAPSEKGPMRATIAVDLRIAFPPNLARQTFHWRRMVSNAMRDDAIVVLTDAARAS
jgi:hypothetical protein